MEEVLSVVPGEIGGEEAGALVNATQTAERWAVGVQDNAVSTSLLNTNTVVCEAVRRVEVEDPEKTGTLEDNDLVALILEGDVGLVRVQPAILLLGPLHLAVKVVQEVVAEDLVIDKVELAASVVEAVAVALTREVKPFGVSKLVSFEVEVSLTSKTVCDQTDHLVQSHTALNDGGELAQSRHVCVHLGITEPEEKSLVTD